MKMKKKLDGGGQHVPRTLFGSVNATYFDIRIKINFRTFVKLLSIRHSQKILCTLLESMW